MKNKRAQEIAQSYCEAHKLELIEVYMVKDERVQFAVKDGDGWVSYSLPFVQPTVHEK